MTDDAKRQSPPPDEKQDPVWAASDARPDEAVTAAAVAPAAATEKTAAKGEPKKADEDPVGKVYDSILIKRLGHYLKPYWVQAVISSVSVTLKSLSDVAGPYLMKVGIDRYMTGKPGPATTWLTRRLPADPWTGVTRLAELYLGALLAAYLFEFIQTYLMQWVGQKIMFDLRRDIFRHMQRLHVGFFDTHAVGRLVTRLTSDVDAINEMFTGGILAIVDDFFTFSIMGIVMLSITTAMKLSAKKSSTMARTPPVNISLMASTSEVRRVTRRPTGCASKKPTCMRCMWRKMSRRRSNMIFCPVHCIR